MLYDKVEKVGKILDQRETIGEHGLETLGVNFTAYRDIEVKSLEE